MLSAPTNTAATKIGGEDHGEGLELRQHGDDDAGVAEAGRQVLGQIALEARHLARAGEPGQGTGDQAGAQQHGATGHAGDRRRRGRCCRPPGLEAPDGAVEVEPDQDGRDQRDDEAGMDAGAGDQARQGGVGQDRCRLRPAQAHRILHRPFQQHADDQQGDEVEQQRGHHLVDAEPELEQGRPQHEQRAGGGAGGEDQRDQNEGRQVDRARAQGHGGDRTHIELALGADVPQRARNATATARPVRIKGVARVRVSLSANQEPKLATAICR